MAAAASRAAAIFCAAAARALAAASCACAWTAACADSKAKARAALAASSLEKRYEMFYLFAHLPQIFYDFGSICVYLCLWINIKI